MRRRSTAYLLLAVAALLYGATFVVVKDAIVILPPFAFVGWRFLLGAAALLVLARPRSAAVWRDGLFAGVFLFAGYAFQTVGLARTSAANSGLITGLYVVFTPLVAALVRRVRPGLLTIGGALIAFTGLGLLTTGDGVRLGAGDSLTVLCAAAFAAHIVILSRVAARHPVVPFTAIQLLVTSLLALTGSAIAEGFPLPTTDVAVAIVMTGLGVSAAAMLIQVWAQTVVGPSRTAIVLALEPAFAAAAAAIVLGERLTLRGWVGAAIILGAIYLVLAFEDDDVTEAEAITPAH